MYIQKMDDITSTPLLEWGRALCTDMKALKNVLCALARCSTVYIASTTYVKIELNISICIFLFMHLTISGIKINSDYGRVEVETGQRGIDGEDILSFTSIASSNLKYLNMWIYYLFKNKLNS